MSPYNADAGSFNHFVWGVNCRRPRLCKTMLKDFVAQALLPAGSIFNDLVGSQGAPPFAAFALVVLWR